MSRAYESVHRLQNNLNHKNQNLTSQQNRTNIYTKNDRFSRNEEIHCENSDETNLFYSFQMQVEECDRDNSNSGKYQQQMYTPASSKTLQLPVLQLPCEKCDKTFPSKQSLSAHIRIFHGPSLNKTPDGHVQHECEYCHKLFSQATGLAEHRRIHTGEKPYQCKVCLKSFSRSIYLCVHSRSHTGERPYSCKICNKSFTQKKSLSSHARIHTGERPFSCTECHKPFARSSYLRIHMRSHTGERPYTCAVCDKSFSQKTVLVGAYEDSYEPEKWGEEEEGSEG
ncbi:oocyte zinc finger protein XlCOF28-like [Ctenocephalides felis]|uniref:oocyte zinc finger protein XlCOF28-like n=1 Tax=Ctenocephalides felis TaxID=7515 RepID=UPI000E6E53A9|nr:oocyte zinc finger protein XlCOF28-like [Ctenocephalides felis]